jgi:hypothetical protein
MIKGIVLAASAAIGVGGMAIGAVAVAPPARADCYQPDCYAAIAFSPSARAESFVANDPGSTSADNDAVAECNKKYNVTDCEVVATSSNCVAIATNPTTKAYHGGTGTTQAAADQAALSFVPGGSILDHGCTG